MCRLFAQVGGIARTAEHFLLDASQPFRQLGAEHPHGGSLAGFDRAGNAIVHKFTTPIHATPGYDDAVRGLHSPLILSHLRNASPGMGGILARNEHMWARDGRIFAHNGAFHDKRHLDGLLRGETVPDGSDTDSARYFAILNRAINDLDGDVREAVARTIPMLEREAPAPRGYNFVLGVAGRDGAPDELWALRNPATNSLFLRTVGADHAARGVAELGTHPATIAAAGGRSGLDAAHDSMTIVTSQPLDHEHGWQEILPGQLVHVRAGSPPQIEQLLPPRGHAP